MHVFNGFTGAAIGGPLGGFYAYDPGFRGGVLISTGDIDGDGRQDIITGVDAGVGPHVKVFGGRTGGEIRSFFAYDPQFLGGVRVAAGDVNGDGRDNVIVGSGSAGPHVKVFDGMTGNEIASFFAYDLGFLHGIYVAAGDVNGDGRAEVITGTGTGPAACEGVRDHRPLQPADGDEFLRLRRFLRRRACGGR